MTENGIVFITAETSLVLGASDSESGVKLVSYQVDDEAPSAYTRPLKIDRHGPHTIGYFATDRVNNRESRKTLTVFVDNTPPLITLSYSVNPKMDAEKNMAVIPESALLYIEAKEMDTAIDKITYSLNGEKTQLYRKPLSNFTPGETLTLKISATDRLGNQSEKEISFWVE
ncbi:MAG: hypothetical protein O3B73_11085 [bacterium]|nr:hypothetical protein [bacterium]